GLYQVRNRYLNPQLGVWLTRDPVAAGAQQDYSYSNSSPVVRLDPNGLQDLQAEFERQIADRERELRPQLRPGGYPGGWFNPGNWWRGVYTGNPNAPDLQYNAALDAAGETVLCWWDCEVTIH